MSLDTELRAPILRLPAEILFYVFDMLAREDIKSLRNVSRRISRVAARYQFGRVILRDETGRSRIKRGIATLGSYLERTRYVSENPPERHLCEYNACIL